MAINFSFRNTKKEKEEKYPESAVLTYTKTEGTSKFQLNAKAFELLEFEEGITTGNMIAFARIDQDNDFLVLVNTSKAEEGEVSNQSRVTLGKDFADSKLAKRMSVVYKKELETGDEFLMAMPDGDEGLPYLTIVDRIVEVNGVASVQTEKVSELLQEELEKEEASDSFDETPEDTKDESSNEDTDVQKFE